MLNHSSLRTSVNPTVQAITAQIPPTRSPEPPNIPFARFPHAMAADTRLSPTDRLVGCALTFWARDRSTADMANKSLASYVGVSIPTVERSVKALIDLGYVATQAVKPTAVNMTGRVVTLRWVEDPTVLPAPPMRSTSSATTTRSAEPKPDRGSIRGDGALVEGTSVAMDPVHQDSGAGSISGDGGGPSVAMDKEDRLVKKAKKLENAGTESQVVQRQRPQADDQPAVSSAPLARTLDRAMVDIKQAASMADEPINAGPGSLLTEGQRRAIGAMTEAEREAFERKSPGMRSDILRPFERGFEPKIFERQTRTMLTVPRFVAERRPVERTTPGLVSAVAGGDPRFVAELAESLCRDFDGPGDRRRWGAIYKLAEQLLARAVQADDVLDAYRQAMGPKAENRGAVFTTALKRTGWKPGSSVRV